MLPMIALRCHGSHSDVVGPRRVCSSSLVFEFRDLCACWSWSCRAVSLGLAIVLGRLPILGPAWTTLKVIRLLNWMLFWMSLVVPAMVLR